MNDESISEAFESSFSSKPVPSNSQQTTAQKKPTLNIGGENVTLEGFDGDEDAFYEKDI